jgi:hypothetical protein
MSMNKDILTVKDLNKYLPALKTEIDIHFKINSMKDYSK